MTARQSIIPLEAKEEWIAAFAGIDHTFGHTWENCYAMHLTTGEKTFLYHYEKNNTRIVCPLIEREHQGYVDISKPPGFSGFVGNGICPDFYEEWMMFAKDQGYISGFLGINPLFDFSCLFNSKEIFTHKKVYILDIEPHIKDILKGMSRGRREQCKRFEKDKHNILIKDKEELKVFFLDEYDSFLRRKGSDPSAGLKMKSLNYLVELDHVNLIGAKHSGRVVAVSLLTYTGENGEYLLHVSLPEGQKYSAPIICQGISYFKSIGVKNINLGGDTTAGIAKFKQRFGCKEIPLKCLKQIYRPDVYNELCRNAGINPEDFTGFFPAYRQFSV